MRMLISGIVLGLVLGFGAHAAAQWGNRQFDERSKDWNERQYERHQDQWRQPLELPRRPC